MPNLSKSFIYRSWKYWQLGYSLFLTKPIALLQFITVMYVLLLERISIFKMFLPHFTYFLLFTLIVLVPLGCVLGWFYMRKSGMFGVESILATESNPQTVHIQRVSMEQTIEVLKALNVNPSTEFLELYEYWKKLDNKMRWKP